MKRILGLDLGTNSIGWALVDEAESKDERSSIVKLGVRVNPLTVDELTNFEKGKSITTNADRTLKRGMRRNLQRYKLRRETLVEVLKEHKLITEDTILSENGNRTTFETYRLRAKAATAKISLEEFARVLLMINKKRGYKSNRKAKGAEEGTLIDGMDIARELYNNNLTPGELCLQLLDAGKKFLPDFYRSDLQNELDGILEKQKEYYPEILTVSPEDCMEFVKANSEHGGADVVLEVAGAESTFKLAWECARPNAIVTVVALYDKAQMLPLPDMYGKNLTFKTGGVDGCDCEETLNLIADGKINTEPLITHTYPLSRIEEAYELFENKRNGVIKVAVEC